MSTPAIAPTVASLYDPALPARVKALLTEEFGELPRCGIAAGQAVASAIFALMGKHEGVFNDIDVFVRHKNDVARLIGESWRNKMRTKSVTRMEFGYRSSEFSSPVFSKGSYAIQGCCYIGRINLVAVESMNGNGDFDILSGFDINACEAALNLETGELSFTPAFEDFLTHWVLDVTTYFTPAHTALRLAKKMKALDARLNRTAMLRLQTVMAVVETSQRYCNTEFTGGMMMAEEKTEQAINEPLISEHFTFRYQTIEFDDGPVRLMQMSPKASEPMVLSAIDTMFNFFGNGYHTIGLGVFSYVWHRVFEKKDMTPFNWLHGTATQLGVMTPEYGFGRGGPDGEDADARYDLRYLLMVLFFASLKGSDREALVSRTTCMERAFRMFTKHERFLYTEPLKNATLPDILTMAKNINWLEKNRYHYVIGYYETDNIAFLPALHRQDFSVAIKPIIARMEKTMLSNTVPSRGEALASAINANGRLHVTEVLNERDLVVLGAQQRHCVGGYFSHMKSGSKVIFRAVGDDGNLYTLSYDILKKDGEIALQRGMCKGLANCRLPEPLLDSAPRFFSESGHDEDWFLSQPAQQNHDGSMREEDFDFDDDIPF